MASSRIFVRGLPPTLTEPDFQRHFGTVGSVTDAKLFAKRRIGYVGYASSDEAAKAVKYFNKSFIRMSKLSVEIARPIGEAPTAKREDPRDQSSPRAATHDASPSAGSRDLKRKRGQVTADPPDPKLNEFLDVMGGRLSAHKHTSTLAGTPSEEPATTGINKDPDGEDLQTISKRPKKLEAVDEHPQEQIERSEKRTLVNGEQTESGKDERDHDTTPSHEHEVVSGQVQGPTSDTDWMRSRTNRVLDLVEDDARTREPTTAAHGGDSVDTQASVDQAEAEIDAQEVHDSGESVRVGSEGDPAEHKIRSSQRLYLRNLAYSTNEAILRETFSAYPSLTEVHVPVDSRISQIKGFAFLLFDDPDEAVAAWRSLDGKAVNGRLLHILPGTAKRETQLDEFALSKLPLKKQQLIKRRRDASSTTFNWNALYMNTDAVMSSVADRLGIDKASLLDPTSSDAAVKQAHAETHVIQETKSYFKAQGVNLDAFGKSKRGDTAILVKNFPYDAKSSELKMLFEQYGKVKRFLVPPAGTIAVVEFHNAPEARSAYSSLAYRKFKNTMLYLEKAPADLFRDTDPQVQVPEMQVEGDKPKPSATDLLQQPDIPDNAPTATLFIRNLNFSTSTNRLDEVFRPLDGFLSARVKTKTDPKKPGQTLSMGFGFLEFRTKDQAQKALSAMDGYNLDGHDLQIRASHKGHDAAEQRRNEDRSKKDASKQSKLVIKNLPFEASKKDVRALLSAYGQLRSVRVPKKIGQSTRGFAFAEFTTPKEAENALDALKDTHLLGRRLAIDYAAEDPEDAEEEIEKMQSKVGSQLNKVAVQKLMGDGRKKFSVHDQGQEEI